MVGASGEAACGEAASLAVVEGARVGAARGRCAVARRGAARGELVAAEPALVAPVLRRELWAERCAFCLARLPAEGSGGRCGRCRMVHYCCREHQRGDFARDHRAECGVLAQLTASPATAARVEDALLLARVVRGGAAVCAAVEAMHLDPQARGDEAAACEALAATVRRAFALDVVLLPGPRLPDALRRFRCNNFGVVDELYNTIAAGVFPRGALLNHSCDPNCVLAYAQRGGTTVQVIRLLRPVLSGEELCHAYCDSAWPTPRRRDYLEATYGFRCDCRFCDGSSRERRLLEDDELVHIAASQGCDEAALRAFAALPLDQRERPRHVALVGEALTAALATGDLTLAAQASHSLVKIYESLYTPFHPLVGLQLYTQADLLEATGQGCGQAFCTLVQRAADVMRVSQADGADSLLCRSLLAKLAAAT
jgi:hypothetical protein